MNAETILAEIKPLGQDTYRKVLLNHGAKDPCLGVKIEHLKKFQKRIKQDYHLALELYDTGVYDAMYLAGLIADDQQMTKEDLRRWARKACDPLAGSIVPWVAAGSKHGWDLGLEWIESKDELIATAGWATLSCIVSIKPDAEVDCVRLVPLLERVRQTIHDAPNAVRYQMNGFVIATGCYVRSLTATAIKIAEAIGQVTVDMGETACQVPFAPDYIRKVEQRGTIGKKRKSAKC